MAPEALRNRVQKDLGTKVDVYSFGIIMHEVFFEQVPYSELKVDSIIGLGTDVMNGLRPYVPEDIVVSENEGLYLELMRKCWHNDPVERPSFDDIFTVFSRMEST
jgi:hypothetical protein